MLLAFMLAQTEPPPEDVVVTGERRRCVVKLHGAKLSKGALDRYAAIWGAGREVRIHVGSTDDIRCMTKILFQLTDRGVTRATFVDDRAAPQP